MQRFSVFFLAFSLLLPCAAEAALSNSSKYMLVASQYVLAKRYREAEQMYSQVIAAEPERIDAYLQRSVVRKEMGNAQGSMSDAKAAARLANAALGQNPRSPKLYHQRGTAYRFLRQFAQARADIEAAIRLKGPGSGWETDLQAIALEEKMVP